MLDLATDLSLDPEPKVKTELELKAISEPLCAAQHYLALQCTAQQTHLQDLQPLSTVLKLACDFTQAMIQ